MKERNKSDNKTQPNEKWVKASILGTTWASSEIVLGSFLHNLRVPFSGNILTAIGLVILISASYLWREKGLFWRAGLICALLKTMSPSAVIFGPMIAIFAEALLLELAVRIFGKNILGFLIGSVLAMSWILFQRIANYIIFYGATIVDLYQNLMQFAAKQFNWNFDAVWTPILLLLAGYGVFGIFSALIGIKTGKNLHKQIYQESNRSENNRFYTSFGKKGKPFRYSSVWLAANSLLLVTVLILANKLSPVHWAILSIAVVAIWAIRYKRALRQLMRPKFWISFFVITMLTSLLFTSFPADQQTIIKGLVIGIRMNIRAIILIMGFTVLGTELYNPKIRHFIHNSWFRQVSMSLELSLETLPSMIAQIPDLKTIVKNPVSIISQILLYAEKHLEKFHQKKARIFILTGEIGQGKTSLALRLAKKLKSDGKRVGGILSPKKMEDGQVAGYNVCNLSDGIRKPFLILKTKENTPTIGRFSILPDGLIYGIGVLESMLSEKPDLIIVDEVGRLELDGNGWAPAIEKLISTKDANLLFVVRDTLMNDILKKWSILPGKIYFASNEEIFEILQLLNSESRV